MCTITGILANAMPHEVERASHTEAARAREVGVRESLKLREQEGFSDDSRKGANCHGHRVSRAWRHLGVPNSKPKQVHVLP